MDDITDKLNMTAQMREALASDELATKTADTAFKAKDAARVSDLKDEAMERMKAKYMDNWKTQPRGMKGISSIPDMKPGVYQLDDFARQAKRSALLKKAGRGIGKGLGAATGIASFLMQEDLNPDSGSPEVEASAVIEDPKSTTEEKDAATALLQSPDTEEDSYFADLRNKKMARVKAAAAEPEEEMDLSAYPSYGPDLPMPEQSEEEKAFYKKQARVKAIRAAIKDGTY